MTKKEALERLAAINELCGRVLSLEQPMMTHTHKVLEKIQAIASKKEITHKAYLPQKQTLEHIIISCDASITKNPGGQAAVGVVVQFPNVGKYAESNKMPLILSRRTKAKSNNQAEYDAIYYGLTSLINLHNNPGCKIEVRSDSQIIINQLNKDCAANDEKLAFKRDSILELVSQIPVPVEFVWRPRNSTPELEQANYSAQNEINVRNH